MLLESMWMNFLYELTAQRGLILIIQRTKVEILPVLSLARGKDFLLKGISKGGVISWLSSFDEAHSYLFVYSVFLNGFCRLQGDGGAAVTRFPWVERFPVTMQ